MQCACYIAESNDNNPLRLNPCPEHERWAKAIRAVERNRVLEIAGGLMETPAYRQFEQQVQSGAKSAWGR